MARPAKFSVAYPTKSVQFRQRYYSECGPPLITHQNIEKQYFFPFSFFCSHDKITSVALGQTRPYFYCDRTDILSKSSSELVAPQETSSSSFSRLWEGTRGLVGLHWCPELCSGVDCGITELFLDPEQLQPRMFGSDSRAVSITWLENEEALRRCARLPGCIWPGAQTGRELLS